MNNVAVFEKVLGYTRKENWSGVYWEKQGLVWHQVPDFCDAKNDLLVLRYVHDRWRCIRCMDELQRFYDKLSELLRSRDPYYHGTVNQYELYYIENYQTGDYARAALYAVGHDDI